MPIPIYYGVNYKRIPALFDFTSKSDLFSIQESSIIAKDLDRPMKNKILAIVGEDEEIKSLLNQKYERGNVYRFFDLYFISILPIYYVCSYRSKDGNYYDREITWWGWIINQSFTVAGVLGYLLLYGLLTFVYYHFGIVLSIILVIGATVRIFILSAKRKKKKEKEMEDFLKQFKTTEYLVNASNYKEMTDELAESLSKIKNKSLYLNGLTKLTDTQAEYLSKFGGKEFFISRANGLKEKQLQLNGLAKITDKQAESLSKFIGQLRLNGLTKITDKQAKSLFSHKMADLTLYLDGLNEITDEQARYISKFNGGELHLNGIKKLTDEQAKYLSKCHCHLYLNGLEEITDKQAEYFSSFRSDDESRITRLYITGLKKTTANQNRILSKSRHVKYI